MKKEFKSLKDAHISILSQTLIHSQEVVFAYLFGSYASGNFTDFSDIDVAVFLETKETNLDDYLSLHHRLSQALHNDKIDLIIINRTKNLILLDLIVREGIVLCDKDKNRRLNFEVRIIHDTIDFRQQRKALIGR